MRIKEAAQAVGCTCRAIKFYEEKGLLPAVARQENGYRDYTQEDLRRLHEIQAYRKLGIGVEDIRHLLSSDDGGLLQGILEKKRGELLDREQELRALEDFLSTHDAQALDEAIDFDTLSQAIRAQLPGLFGRYLAAHFAPYLRVRITTQEQREAYAQVLAFWDHPGVRLPLLLRLSLLLTAVPNDAQAERMAAQMDAQIKAMLSPDEAAYARIREQTRIAVERRECLPFRLSPIGLAKRQTMRRLKNCGYYDVFLPALERLSPPYRAYRDALRSLNDRLCRDLSLYYDADFHLRRKLP